MFKSLIVSTKSHKTIVFDAINTLQIKAKSAEAALQATHQIAQSQESANKELINMAQHILKSHAKKQG